jgi:hypothetical protein
MRNPPTVTHGSISPTFYTQLFCTKVSRKAFFVLEVKVKVFIGAKKMAQLGSKKVDEIDSRAPNPPLYRACE